MNFVYSSGVIITAFVAMAFSQAEGQADAHNYVEYGALGLCFIMTMFLCRYLVRKDEIHKCERNDLVKSISKRDEELINLTRQNINSQNRLAEMLGDRPCLMKDKRINEPTA